MRLKAKIKNGVIEAKVGLVSPMAGIEEAKRRNIDVNFISYIVASVNGEVVYEISTGPFISENPLFKFKFKGASKGDKLKITTSTNSGKKESKKTKIK